MALSFREFANLLNKAKCLPEIAKPEASLDAVSFLQQLPVWGLYVKKLSFLAVSGGIPPRQGVQVLPARASVMLLAPRVNRRRLDQLGRSRVRHRSGAGALSASITRAGVW